MLSEGWDAKTVTHIMRLRAENTDKVVPVFDSENPIRSTSRMRTWYTSKPCEYTEKSHINHVVVDSTWEASEAYRFEFLILETKGQDSDLARTKRAYLQEWVKAVNNHGGFGQWREAISYNPNDLSEILKNNR